MNGVLERLSWRQLDRPDAARDLAGFVHRGGLVVFPTESSYALGADPTHADAVASVYRLKRRPASKPLPVVIGSSASLGSLGVRLPKSGLLGLEAAWPGPLTIILPSSRRLPAAAGSSELAVRIPGHGKLRGFLEATGVSLTATSANLSGEEPLLDSRSLEEFLGDEAVAIIDEGKLAGGPPSTVLRLRANVATIVRPGALSTRELRKLAPTVQFQDSFSASAVEIPVEENS